MVDLNNRRQLVSARRLAALMLLFGLLLGESPGAYAQVLRQETSPVLNTPNLIQNVALEEILVQLETDRTATQKLSDDLQSQSAAVEKLLTEIKIDPEVCPPNQSESSRTTTAQRTTDAVRMSVLAQDDITKIEDAIKILKQVTNNIGDIQKKANAAIIAADTLQTDATNTLNRIKNSQLPEADKTQLQKKVKEAQDKLNLGKEKAQAAEKDLDAARAKVEEAIKKLEDATNNACDRKKLTEEAQKLAIEATEKVKDASMKLLEAQSAIIDGFNKLAEVKKTLEEKKVP
ncbi:MAG: hypothetical protein KME64_33990 [Scytonematopsis contorta HA4267-MV1]|jgi:cell division protein FtsB|nr:hypothetical protein [Scytonematopsis contorta HA4267-MV1]